MTFIIYTLENEDVFLESYTSTSYTLTEDVDLAQEFNSPTEANAVLVGLPGSDEFWGTKPKPPHQ